VDREGIDLLMDAKTDDVAAMKRAVLDSLWREAGLRLTSNPAPPAKAARTRNMPKASVPGSVRRRMQKESQCLTTSK
jgi:hypothetical protein